ncbi:MAG: decarboxylase [Desulfococcaceae bacterium]
MNSKENIVKKTKELLHKLPPILEDRELLPFVRSFTERSSELLKISADKGSPLWLIETDLLEKRALHFLRAFRNEIGEVDAFYAMKSNNHPAVADCLIQAGMGLDVSGGPELELALLLGCKRILFSGPGKNDAELRLALANKERVTILMDSFTELRRISQMACEQGIQMKAGIRLTTQEKGLWRKFGIPLSALKDFLNEAEKTGNVKISGLQFHTSWNLNPSAQTAFIARLGNCLKMLDEKYPAALEFIDIGGGYWPEQGEWLQREGTPGGQLQRLLSPESPRMGGRYRYESMPIEKFASDIGNALREHIFPLLSCRIYTEPGRWICNDAMHLLMKVLDKKADDIVISDAGINNIGWERFETDYFPVINLSRPGLCERECYVFGCLCTPHDIWGYTYFGHGIETGDILLIPCQGAYTYSLGQQFIKPVAKCVLTNFSRHCL